jgi:hypothetical protein
VQTKKIKKQNSEAILETARKRFQLAVEANTNIRNVALEDLKFRAGEQWDDAVKAERQLDQRPCLVINRIPQFIRQITNDQRQNRPSIKVHPVDDNADIETAKILQGIIKHIESNSSADVAYDTAFAGACEKGFGYFRIITDYIDPESFEQEALIEPILNSFSVYLDVNSKKPDGSDANWGFIFSDIPKEDYEAEYGDSELASMSDWESIGATRPGWVTESTVRVVEYFCKEFETVDVCQLETGKSIRKAELEKLYPEGIPEGMVINEKKAKVEKIKWYKINGIEILEQTDWLGKWIPIIPVYGDILDVDGELILEGVIRHSKDSQRMYNYWKSTETETIALAPRAPYIAAEGQIPPEYKEQWAQANRKNFSVLTYKATALGGHLVGAPQRNIYEPPVQAITQASLHAAEDLKATTGIYDAALGNRSNENSGIAIQRRANQSQTSNFHFVDNLTRSLKHAGRILVDLIPKIYDTTRAVRIIGEESEQEIIRVNEVFKYKGKETTFNLGFGKYDVAVETGPNFATRRMESAASMVDMARNAPQIMQSAPDLVVKAMDWPGASEIAERLKKTLPPGLADDSKDQQPIPAAAKAQMDQMSQVVEQLTQKLNEATEEKNRKLIEIESKERIEFAKMEVDLKKEMIKAQSQYANEALLSELADIQARLNLLGINRPISEDFEQSQEIPEQEQNGFSPDQAMSPENIQPTDGFTSGPQPQGEF